MKNNVFYVFHVQLSTRKKNKQPPEQDQSKEEKENKTTFGKQGAKKKKDERKVSDKGSVHQEMWYSEEDSHVVLSITRIVPITGQQNCQASVHRGKFIKKEW